MKDQHCVKITMVISDVNMDEFTSIVKDSLIGLEFYSLRLINENLLMPEEDHTVLLTMKDRRYSRMTALLKRLIENLDADFVGVIDVTEIESNGLEDLLPSKIAKLMVNETKKEAFVLSLSGLPRMSSNIL